MKQKAVIITVVLLALATSVFLFLRSSKSSARSALQRVVDQTKPDVSSENGMYGHYRIYTGMLLCKDCDSIAARMIVKSERADSTDGVATFETTKIIAGGKPLKQPIQKALWALLRGQNDTLEPTLFTLLSDKEPVASFLIDQGTKEGTKWKILVEANASGAALSSSENRVGKLVLIAEGNTTP